ncbi:MAG: type II secretion system protein [Sedimentisphaerales bacterium]|nr:type II secretion system protein [Sedimentisphaerales bacterium]
MRRTKGFTLVELLVVIGIIALLVSILMPALGRARELAKRIQCASQLNGIGKAVAMYQNEYHDQNPGLWRLNPGVDKTVWGFGGAGGTNTMYNSPGGTNLTYWCDTTMRPNMINNRTVGQCLYLLVKHEDVDVKMFVCPSADDIPMTLDDAIDYAPQSDVENWEDLHDFQSCSNLSYSYNDPWNRILDSSASASQVLMADKSPAFSDWDDSAHRGFISNVDSGGRPKTGDDEHVGTKIFGGTWDDSPRADAPGEVNLQHGNSKNHATECQNVLFADTHVKKYATPCVGVNEDNIFTYSSQDMSSLSDPYAIYMIGRWGKGGSAQGEMYDAALSSASDRDSYLGN